MKFHSRFKGSTEFELKEMDSSSLEQQLASSIGFDPCDSNPNRSLYHSNYDVTDWASVESNQEEQQFDRNESSHSGFCISALSDTQFDCPPSDLFLSGNCILDNSVNSLQNHIDQDGRHSSIDANSNPNTDSAECGGLQTSLGFIVSSQQSLLQQPVDGNRNIHQHKYFGAENPQRVIDIDKYSSFYAGTKGTNDDNGHPHKSFKVIETDEKNYGLPKTPECHTLGWLDQDETKLKVLANDHLDHHSSVKPQLMSVSSCGEDNEGLEPCQNTRQKSCNFSTDGSTRHTNQSHMRQLSVQSDDSVCNGAFNENYDAGTNVKTDRPEYKTNGTDTTIEKQARSDTMEGEKQVLFINDEEEVGKNVQDQDESGRGYDVKYANRGEQKDQVESVGARQVKFDAISIYDGIKNEPVMFSALMCITEEDEIAFGRSFVQQLCEWNCHMFLPRRDLVLTGPYHENLARVIKERCNGKILVIVSKTYPQSEECLFLTYFAKALDPAGRRRNIIPLYIDRDVDIPNVLSGLSGIRYNQAYRNEFLRSRLLQALEVRY